MDSSYYLSSEYIEIMHCKPFPDIIAKNVDVRGLFEGHHKEWCGVCDTPLKKHLMTNEVFFN